MHYEAMGIPGGQTIDEDDAGKELPGAGNGRISDPAIEHVSVTMDDTGGSDLSGRHGQRHSAESRLRQPNPQVFPRPIQQLRDPPLREREPFSNLFLRQIRAVPQRQRLALDLGKERQSARQGDVQFPGLDRFTRQGMSVGHIDLVHRIFQGDLQTLLPLRTPSLLQGASGSMKSETRSPKQIRSPKHEVRNRGPEEIPNGKTQITKNIQDSNPNAPNDTVNDRLLRFAV